MISLSHNMAEVAGFALVPVAGGLATRALASATKPETHEALMKQALIMQICAVGLAFWAAESLGGRDAKSFASGGVWGAGVSAGILAMGLMANSFPPTALPKKESASEEMVTAVPGVSSLSKSQVSMFAKLLTGGAAR